MKENVKTHRLSAHTTAALSDKLEPLAAAGRVRLSPLVKRTFSTEMADTDEVSRDVSKQNPFRMPTDEEIFSLRDEERARKEEVRAISFLFFWKWTNYFT